MKANETPNETNYRKLKQRFANENGFKNEYNLDFEVDFGNEPITIKIIDIDENEHEHEIEKITGNENETTLHFKNENENGFGNENETGNEIHFRNELEMNSRNELLSSVENEVKNMKNKTENEMRFENELINSMKSELLFYSEIIDFQDIPSYQKPKDNRTEIIVVTKDNVFHLYQRYKDTVKIYLEKQYLTTEEIEDFKQASQRYIMLQKLNDKLTLNELLKNPENKTGIISHDHCNEIHESESTPLSEIASNFLHRISKRIHK